VITKLNDILLKVEDLKKWFPLRKGIAAFLSKKKREYVRAVDGISFQISRQEIFGLVGESGCGKTTTGRVMVRLTEPTAGRIYFNEQDIATLKPKELKSFRAKAQIIFQDPYASLNPRMMISSLIEEPLLVHNIASSRAEREKVIAETIESVGLAPWTKFARKYPRELSGGERQRVAVARALVLRPEFIVADEPVSMLDVSIRYGILKLLMKLREEFKISLLFITHDLAVARHTCDRIAVMYLGKMVEVGSAEEICTGPLHPYTYALTHAIPELGQRLTHIEVLAKGMVPSAVSLPTGCRFHPRCPYAEEVCMEVEPELVETQLGHYVACHKSDRFRG